MKGEEQANTSASQLCPCLFVQSSQIFPSDTQDPCTSGVCDFSLSCHGLDADAQGCLILADGIEMLFSGHGRSSMGATGPGHPLSLGPSVISCDIGQEGLRNHAASCIPEPCSHKSFASATTVIEPAWLNSFLQSPHSYACSRSSTWDEIFSS